MLHPSKWVQMYLALAYVKSRQRHSANSDDFWKQSAITDTAIIVYFGPLTFWLPYAILTRSLGEHDTAIIVASVLGAGALAWVLAFRAAKSQTWRDIVQKGGPRLEAPDDITIVKLCVGTWWCFVAPFLSWKLSSI